MLSLVQRSPLEKTFHDVRLPIAVIPGRASTQYHSAPPFLDYEPVALGIFIFWEDFLI